MPTKFKSESGLPTIEFEGPLGFFWDMSEVPIESLAKGILELWRELTRRGYPDTFITEMVKKQSQETPSSTPVTFDKA